jgi:multiple sugar transport system substrate-binding protein
MIRGTTAGEGMRVGANGLPSRIGRRAFLKLAAGAGLAAGGAIAVPPAVQAASEVSLSFWSGSSELPPFYNNVIDAYRKTHPNVKFTLFTATLREAEQKLSAAVPTGTGPDIFDIGINIAFKFIEGGLLNPNPPDVIQYLRSGAWNPFVVDFFTIGGKSYGLPLLEGSHSAMYYNKSMFREAGLGGPPTTFAELTDAARKLTKFDGTGKMVRSGISLRLSGQGSGVAEKFEYVLEPAGGSLVVKAPGGKWRNGYDNAAGRAALQFYVDAVQKYKIDDPKVQHDANAFIAGNTAMLFREPWVTSELKQKNPTLEYGVAPIPRWREGGPYKMLSQPWGIYVNGKSSNKDVAWDFLRFLTNRDNAFRLTAMTGLLTARQDVDWKPLLKETPQLETFVSPPKSVQFFVEPVLTVWDEIETKLASRLSDAYVDPSLNDNPAKIAETIAAMAKETDDLLRGAGLYGTA